MKKELLDLGHTPNHISRKWERNSNLLDKFQQAGFSVFYNEKGKCTIERIDDAESWSKDFGYPIKQLKSDTEAIEIARTVFGLPVNDDGLIVDFK